MEEMDMAAFFQMQAVPEESMRVVVANPLGTVGLDMQGIALWGDGGEPHQMDAFPIVAVSCS